MTINFRLTQKKKLSTIYVRISETSKIQLITTTRLYIDFKDWSIAKQRHKDKDDPINNLLGELYLKIQKQFTKDYSKGLPINKRWLSKLILDFHNRSETPEDNFFDTYFRRYIDKRNEIKLNVVLDRFKEFQALRQTSEKFRKHKEIVTERLLIKDIDSQFSFDYANWMDKNKFLPGYIKQELAFFKRVLRDAKKQGFKIDIEDWVQLKDKEKPDPVFVTQSEIDLIYNHDFSSNQKLDNAKSVFLIGCYTGLRYSDILKVQKSAIKDRILYLRTKKTSTRVEIPIHPRVDEMLVKGFKILSRTSFDKYIKEVCKIAKIDVVVEGRKRSFKSDQGFFPKHELVSSHTARRSFCSNHFGEVPTPNIMAITGHSTESSFYKYIGRESQHSAKVFLDFWDNIKTKEDEK